MMACPTTANLELVLVPQRHFANSGSLSREGEGTNSSFGAYLNSSA
jgi:hypothetical protein